MEARMDIYSLLGEDRNAPGHQHSRELIAAEEHLFDDLACLRKERRLTQADVAERMGTDQATVSRIESRTADVHMSTLRRYAKAIGANITYTVTARTLTAADA